MEQGFADEAFGLIRSLYELSAHLRYITSDTEHLQKRAFDFLYFGLTSKGFWLYLITKRALLSDDEFAEIQRYAAENGITEDSKGATRPWSGERELIRIVSKLPHPTDAIDSDELLRDSDRAISYTDASSYVHCTQPGLEGYTYGWKEPIVIPKQQTHKQGNSAKACRVTYGQL